VGTKETLDELEERKREMGEGLRGLELLG